MTVHIDGMLVTSHTFKMPLDWNRPDSSPAISVGVREVVLAEKAQTSIESLPAICYLRGGPGFETPAPLANSGWLKELLRSHRVFLLDQRGTGRSSPVDASLAQQMNASDLAEYLTHFRADSIVKDAEFVRTKILGDKKWVIQGQSFGGFCTLSYLSCAPAGLDAVINTGGFAPVLHSAAEVYSALCQRVVERNAEYHRQFPDDKPLLARVIDFLHETPIEVCPGWRLTDREFLVQGSNLGFAQGPEEIHGLVERCAADLDSLGTLSRWSVRRAADAMSLSTNPIYAVLHESIYCSGPELSPSHWAADRAIAGDSRFRDSTTPMFTGEMIFPWMFDELPALRPFKAAADLLAHKADWQPLFDVERLRSNDVPVVGTIYYEDLYVDRTFAIETANLVGNCEPWITNEFEHSAYGDNPERVFGKLFEMLDGLRGRAAAQQLSLLS